MTAKELAAMLNGREVEGEITPSEEREAKVAGLVVVYGYSDDNVEFVGAIDDEVGVYEGAITACESWGLNFDSINESLPDWIEVFKTQPRKVGASEYWDDRAIRVEARPRQDHASACPKDWAAHFWRRFSSIP